ncbi:protein of unknown function [Sphingobacterium wenxiniae]|uniref:DUF4286 domain-containing protein n=2 Tax=Sphingobacterium wenxiniae TaxID=683125 RepID=A0A1I6VE09_9SPHI|nr:protein of unknown function [Sphingobacterium wenxiniae]
MQPYFYRKERFLSFLFILLSFLFALISCLFALSSLLSHLSYYFCIMILYNVSVIVEDSAHTAIYEWLSYELKNNAFEAKLLKMLDSPHEGTTYCIQMTVENDEQIAHFQQKFIEKLQERIGTHHPEKAFIFDSRMQYIALD